MLKIIIPIQSIKFNYNKANINKYFLYLKLITIFVRNNLK